MLTFQDLITEDAPIVKESSTKDAKVFSIEDLEKTANYINHLSAPDREVDRMAKLAVFLDLEKTGIFRMGRLDPAYKALKHSAKDLEAAKILNRARKNTLNAERIEKATEALDDPRVLEKSKNIASLVTGGAIAAPVAGYAAYAYGESEKKKELSESAKKYYAAGVRRGRQFDGNK